MTWVVGKRAKLMKHAIRPCDDPQCLFSIFASNESVGQLHCKPQIEISITFMQERFPHIYSN